MQMSSSSPSLTSDSTDKERHGVPQDSPLPLQRRDMRRSHSHEPVPLKDRFYTTLYRFRYGWTFHSSVEFSDIPVWLLGCCYHAEDKDGGRRRSFDTEGTPPHILAFLDHFQSIIWMTYRSNFSTIVNTTINTDCGWGCMVRSGQMILATALNRYLLGSGWRLSSSSKSEDTRHREILSWFTDSPSHECPFSLHALMRVAVRFGHKPGDWFGPSQLALLIRECVLEYRGKFSLLEDFLVYVAHDCTVYVGDVMKLYSRNQNQSLLVLVPVRLGSESLNPIYVPCVKSLLTLDHCVGIIGGKPKHSVYFVGFQDDKLVHLDPHYCQLAAQSSSHNDVNVKSYHCTTPRKLPASRMDPSCTIGFLCTSLQEFEVLRTAAEKVLAPPLQKGVYPFFSFSDNNVDDALSRSVNTHSINMSLAMESESSGRKDKKRKKKKRYNLDDYRFVDDEDFIVVECGNATPEEGEGEGEEEEEDPLSSVDGFQLT